MRKVLFFIICVFIQLNSGVIYGQYINIDGDSRVCYDVNETYTHIPSDDIDDKVYFQRWTATGGTIISGRFLKTVIVVWNSNNDDKELKVEVSYNTGGVDGVNKTITKTKRVELKSKLDHSSVSLDIGDHTRLSLCDEYSLTATEITDIQGGTIDYSWYYQTNNNTTYQLFDQTNNIIDTEAHINSIDLNQFNSDPTVTDIQFKVKVSSSNCPLTINFENTTIEKEVTFCYDLDSVETKSSTCYGFKDPRINIYGLPDPTALAINANNSDTFDITITKYTKAVWSDDYKDFVCSDNIISVNTEDPEEFEGIEGEYCLSGYVVSDFFKFEDDTHEIDGAGIDLKPLMIDTIGCDSIFLYPPVGDPIFMRCKDDSYITELIPDPNSDNWLTGLTDGVYVMDIENYYYSKKQVVFEVEEPRELIFENLVKNSKYTYGGKTFDVTTPNGSDGGIEVTVNGGTPPWTIFTKASQSKAGFDEHVFGNAKDTSDILYKGTVDSLPGDEILIYIQDKNGCAVIDPLTNSDLIKDVTLNPPEVLSITATNINNVTCNVADSNYVADGALEFDITGGIGPYRVKLKDKETGIEDGIDVKDDAFSSTFSTRNYGDYFLMVEDLNKYQDYIIDTKVDQPNPVISVQSSIIPPVCLGGENGSVTLTASGKDTIDRFRFEFIEQNKSVSGKTITYSKLSAGDHPYYVIDTIYNCFAIDTVHIPEKENTVYINSAVSDTVQCYGTSSGEISVSALNYEGYYTFHLYNEEGELLDTLNNLNTFTGVAEGNYTIMVEDRNKCISQGLYHPGYDSTVYVSQNDPVKIDTLSTNVIDKGGKTGKILANLKEGAWDYDFALVLEGDTTDIYETLDTIIIDTLKVGSYTLIAKDEYGCSNTSPTGWIERSFNIKEPGKPLEIILDSTSNPKCFGDNTGFIKARAIEGWGEYTYYLIRETDIDSNKTGEFSNLKAGTYEVMVKDWMGAERSINKTLIDPLELKLNGTQITKVSCFDGYNGEVGLRISGGTKPYFYSIDNWLSEEQDTTVYGLSAGMYEIHIRDANHCYDTVLADINQPHLLIVDSVSITGTLCGEQNGSAVAYVSGGNGSYIYQWINSSGKVFNGNPVSYLKAGKYDLHIMDSLGCDTNRIVIIKNTNGPTIYITETTKATCSGYTDGKVFYEIVNTEGIPPFTLELYFNNQATAILTLENLLEGIDSITGLQDGHYQILLTDQNGCISVAGFDITTPDPINIFADEIENPLCFGSANGYIKISATGGDQNYTYLWSTNSTENSISGLNAGTYTVTINDSKGCNTSAEYELINPEKLIVDLGDDVTICTGQDYVLSAGIFYSYIWKYNDEEISHEPNVSIYMEGEYSILVTNENNCPAEDKFYLNVSTDLLEAEFLIPGEAYMNDTVVIIDITWPEPDETYWTYEEGIIPVYSEQYLEEITFNEPGIYNIKLNTSMGLCIDSISKQIAVLAEKNSTDNLKLGAEESIIFKFMVYPNPNFGRFTIDVELSKESDIEIRIFNMQQNQYILMEKYFSAEKYLLDYGFMNLRTGMYLISIQAGNEKQSKRILIAK